MLLPSINFIFENQDQKTHKNITQYYNTCINVYYKISPFYKYHKNVLPFIMKVQ